MPIEHATGGTIRRLIGSFFTAELTTSALCATNRTISPFSSRIQVTINTAFNRARKSKTMVLKPKKIQPTAAEIQLIKQI